MAEITSPVKAIRAYCLDCTGNQPSEVRRCEITRCPLYPFRFGKNPFYGKKGRVEESPEDFMEIAETPETEGI